MNWWNDFSTWSASDHGWRIISGAIIPFVAIVVAGVIAALIGRGATKRVVALHERESRNAAVSGIVAAARKAATWGSLGHDERAYADHLAEDADIRLRLLPVSGAPVAANWAQHEIADIKKNSSTFSFQAEQSLSEFRNRMLDWQARPSRARKLFRADLERWKFDSPDANDGLIERQQQWNANQNDGRGGTEPASASANSVGTVPGPSAGSTAGTAAAGVVAGGVVAGSGTFDRDRQGLPGSGTARFPIARPGAAAETSAPETTAARADGAGPNDGVLPHAVSMDEAASGAAVSPRLGSPVNWPQPLDDGTEDHATTRGETHDVVDGDTDRTATARGTSGSDRDRDNESNSDGSGAIALGGSSSAPADQEAPAAPAGENIDESGTDAKAESGTDADAESTGELTHPKIDAAGAGSTNTTSIPTRIADAPIEPADPDETSEAPYSTPISASELRRRAQDDDED